MGSKRVGLARTQKLLEGLKRELAMGGAEFTGTKGVELTEYGTATALPVAQGNTDLSVSIPANALITDIGLMVSSANVNADSGTTISVRSDGAAASGQGFIAATQVNQTNSDLANGACIWVSAGNIFHASGNPIAFAPAATLFSTSARTVYMRVAVGGADLADANGKVSLVVKYIIKS